MEIKEFMRLLGKAKKDRYGNYYIENKEFDNSKLMKECRKSRWYFCLANTVCSDFVKEYCYKEKDGFEHYNRHFINDDTFEVKIVNEKNSKDYELEE